MTDFISKVPPRDKFIYTANFCEENVWHLCQLLTRATSPEVKCYCVFMSNSARAVHLWRQKCGGDEQPVVWDYHVFAVYGSNKHGYYVLDLDTTLAFPISFKEYAEKAIRCEDGIFKRYFRVILAEEYLKTFSSDRRHMKAGDVFRIPPPKYPPLILDQAHPHNLDDFINMEKGEGPGEVLDCQDFVKRFSF